MKRKILVITPIDHLSGIKDLIENKSDKVTYLSKTTKSVVKNLIEKYYYNTLICNPNTQDYIIDKELLEDTKIKTIVTCSTGTNHIDLKYCEKNNIEVLSLKDDLDLLQQLPATAELAFGLMLNITRNISKFNISVKEYGLWDYRSFMDSQLFGKKVGIVGFGRLGKMMSKYCNAFGCETDIYDPYVNYTPHEWVVGTWVDNIQELFDRCDIISLHVHVTEETKYMIDYNLIKNGNVKYIINTSRGEIVNETDIVRALKEYRLKGYATDVLEDEFGNIKNSIFLKSENINLNTIITPHIGGMTWEGQQKAYEWAINKL